MEYQKNFSETKLQKSFLAVGKEKDLCWVEKHFSEKRYKFRFFQSFDFIQKWLSISIPSHCILILAWCKLFFFSFR